MSDQIHDKGYKTALSFKESFLEFIQQFISKGLVEGVTANDLEPMDKSFVDDTLIELESDVVYKLKRPDKDIYFYVLIELQSKVDFTMPIRIRRYVSRVQDRHFDNTDINVRSRKEYRLPVVIPIVLYNGGSPWSAMLNYRDYQNNIDDLDPTLAHVIPDFSYLLLDVNASDINDLCKTGLLSFILAFDHKDHSKCLWRIKEIYDILNKQERVSAILWLRNTFRKKYPLEDVNKIIEMFEKGDLVEMTYTIERLADEILAEGLEKGLEDGIQKGMQKGIQKGIQKGLEDGIKNIIQTMIRKGKSIDSISEDTDIPISKIEQIKINMELDLPEKN